MSDVEKFWNAVAAKMCAPEYHNLSLWRQQVVLQAVNMLLSVALEASDD